MIGTSPTRPGIFIGNPPEEVAAEISPSWSIATAPTVSLFSAHLEIFFQYCNIGTFSPAASFSFRAFHSLIRASGTLCSAYRSKALAKSSAPLPARSMWSVSSMTFLATRIGLVRLRAAATAPDLRFLPSMIIASSSTSPLRLGHAPRPALKIGFPSSSLIASVTASTEFPPEERTSIPTFAAADTPSANAPESGLIAPPCIIIEAFIIIILHHYDVTLVLGDDLPRTLRNQDAILDV